MFKRNIIFVLLAVGLCFSFATASKAATVINIVAQDALADLAGFQVSILPPSTVTTADFVVGPALGGFSDFSIPPSTLSFFTFDFFNSIDSGVIGSFSETTVLGEWELTNQAGRVLKLGEDYFVTLVGTDYNIVVPIPSAALLLVGGLVGFILVRRRQTR